MPPFSSKQESGVQVQPPKHMRPAKRAVVLLFGLLLLARAARNQSGAAPGSGVVQATEGMAAARSSYRKLLASDKLPAMGPSLPTHSPAKQQTASAAKQNPPAPKPPPQPQPTPTHVTWEDYAALARGVGRVQTSTWPASRQHLFGPAMAIVADGRGAPAISATRHHQGRAVAFGAEGMLDACCSAGGGLGKLLLNAANWAAGKPGRIRIAGAHPKTTDGIVAALVRHSPDRWQSVGTMEPASLARDKVDVYFINREDDDLGQHAARIQQFVGTGGGLILALQAWMWELAGKPLLLHPANILLNPLGIGFGGLWDVVKVDTDLDTASPPSQLAHVDIGMDCLEATCTGNASSHCYLNSNDHIADAMLALSNGAAFIGSAAPLWAQLQRWQAAASQDGINPKNPIQRNSIEGLGALARTISYKHLPLDKLPEAPDAKHFPGLPEAGAQPIMSPVMRWIEGAPAAPYWQCLGMYAMPGKAVTVKLPAGVLAALDKGGVKLHIGGWKDMLYKKTQWARLPEIVRWFSVTSETTRIGSALGGLIYITLPPGLSLGPVRVDVTGAIMAPYYLEGESDPTDWPNVLQYPAPWGEIGSSKLAIAVPASSLQTVKDPSAVATYWDKVQDSNAKLACIPLRRPAPMRFQHDADIAGGYMHSGYPVMAYTVVANSTVDPSAAANHFAHLHELGHNHQVDAWTWTCSREVMCNLFATHAMLTVGNITDPATFYGWNGADRTERQRRRGEYFAAGARFSDLCADSGLHLDSLLTLIEKGGFGFELIRKTFASYQQLMPVELPTNDDAKLQTWVVQQSQVAGLNFAPYYTTWGWPVSPQTHMALGYLPPFNMSRVF